MLPLTLHFRQLFPLLLTLSFCIAEEPPPIVYRWDATAWLANHNRAQFSASAITNPDGSVGAEIAVTPRSAANSYNHVIGTNASLKGGNEYTAMVTFSVVEPTKFPGHFYMFARHSTGFQHDIWRTWIGLPGTTRTIALPLDLKKFETGTWKLHVGIMNSGALKIHKIIVYGGITSDGVHSYTTIPPVLKGTPLSDSPKTVTSATGGTPFTISPPATPQTTLSLADYKFTPDIDGAPGSVAANNTLALQKAIHDCKGKGATKLVIPIGTYRLTPTTGFNINKLDDLTIEGQESTFIFEKLTKEGPAFVIDRCSRLHIQNLNLDWDWKVTPIASLAIISNLTPDRLQCDFTFPDLNATQTAIVQKSRWMGIFEMDPVHLIRIPSNDFVPPPETVITPGSAGNVLHLSFPKPLPLVNGSTYCIRHLYYEMGGFKIANSTDVTFQDVKIYSMPGMGWFFCGAMQNFQLLRCKILRAPGSRTPLTTSADGFHVDQFIENLNIENCSITGTGDDAMNIHNESYQGTILPDEKDPTKITLLDCPSWQLRLNPGDPVDFFNADFSFMNKDSTPTTRQVLKASSVNRGKQQTTIQFTSPIPPEITSQSILINARYKTSNVRIIGCDMEKTGGRGILISAQNVLIESCRFRKVYSSAINLESEILQPLWTEGRGASNVWIKNNTFENSNAQGRYNGALIYTNTRFPWGPTTATLYEQITIENNSLLNSPGPVLSMNNCANVLVRSNEIKFTETIPHPSRSIGTLFFTDSSHLSLGGNQWVNDIPATFPYGVIYDPSTTTNVSTGTNGLIKNHP